MRNRSERLPETSGLAPDQPVTRRKVLGMGLAAAGLSLDGRSRAGLVGAATPDTSTRLTLPKLASSATPAAGNVRRFRSRPDLVPAAVQLDIDRPGQDGGLILMDSHGGPGDQGPMIVDGSGELVWFRRVSGPRTTHRAFNLRVQEWKGKPVLTFFDGDVVAAHGEGRDVIMDSSYNEITTVSAGHGEPVDLHAFTLTSRGTAFLTSYGVAYGDLRPYGGKAHAPYVFGLAVEVDVATGEVVFQWRSDRHVGLDESYAPISRYGSNPWDYFHINAIAFARDGNLIISGRNTWGVYKVGRTTGEVLWRLGGKKSDFALGPGAHFAWQHDANQHADGSLTVFDNGAGDYRTERQSRGLVLTVDEHARKAALERQFLHPGGRLQAGALGSVQLLPGGQAFVGWGIEAAFSQYAADGAPLLSGRLAGRGPQSYRAFRSIWSGVPAEPPTAVAVPGSEAMTLYTSWNGATKVKEWLVLGGDRQTALSGIGTATREGFETVIEVPRRTTFTAVAALDDRGKELARSNVLTV